MKSKLIVNRKTGQAEIAYEELQLIELCLFDQVELDADNQRVKVNLDKNLEQVLLLNHRHKHNESD